MCVCRSILILTLVRFLCNITLVYIIYVTPSVFVAFDVQKSGPIKIIVSRISQKNYKKYIWDQLRERDSYFTFFFSYRNHWSTDSEVHKLDLLQTFGLNDFEEIINIIKRKVYTGRMIKTLTLRVISVHLIIYMNIKLPPVVLHALFFSV